MVRAQKKNVRSKKAQNSSLPEVVTEKIKNDDKTISEGQIEIIPPTERENSNENVSTNIDVPSSDPSDETKSTSNKTIDKTIGEENKDGGSKQILHVHFFLYPIIRGTSGIPNTIVYGSPMVQKIAENAASELPIGTTFELRRVVRIDHRFYQKDNKFYKNIPINKDIFKRKITVCEEYRILQPEFTSILLPCDKLPFHMAFIFDPTLKAEVIHYTNMKYNFERESNIKSKTYFVAVFKGTEVYSIRELVEAFFCAYLDKTEEEVEINHPFHLITSNILNKEPKLQDLNESENNIITPTATITTEVKKKIVFPEGFVSARAFLGEREHHKLVSDPVQQVLVCDRELGIMVLGKALDKRILWPPTRPPMGSSNYTSSKNSTKSESKKIQSCLKRNIIINNSNNNNNNNEKDSVILNVSSPILPPFKLWHSSGVIVDVVGLFTRPSSPIPEFRVRCDANNYNDNDNDKNDNGNSSQKIKKKKKQSNNIKKEEEIFTVQQVMNLEEAHRLLSAMGRKRSREETFSNNNNDSFMLNLTENNLNVLEAFRLQDELGPTLAWLLRSTTAFNFS